MSSEAAENESADRKLVTPGTMIATGRDYRPGECTFREGDSIYSSVIGLADVRRSSVRVIPLRGAYIPKSGDRVIGLVKEIQFMGWMAYIRSPTPGIMKVSEVPYNFDLIHGSLEDILSVGTLIYAEVLSVSEFMQIKLTMNHPDLRKLVGGNIFSISPSKVPRLIGRKGSMISMLKQAISRDILVGQNGIIWTRCNDDKKIGVFKEILQKIETEAHLSGLTNRIKILLKEEVGIEEFREVDSGREKTRRKRPRRTKTH
ncbi:MAG: RNA-binding protein [Theionarchaea archaeon]|nr:RNA-binding protein [Theionarchaea archaeon]